MLMLLARLRQEIKSFLQEEVGQEVIEYTVIFALVTVILFASVSALADQIDSIAAFITNF